MNCIPPDDDNPPSTDDIGELVISLTPPSLDHYGLESNNENTIKSYSIELENPGYDIIKKENLTHFPVIFDMIPVGLWSIRGYAINNENNEIGTGQTNIIVEKYKSTPINIPLSLLGTGNGLFSIYLEWPEDAVTSIHAELEKSEEQSEEIAFTFSTSGEGAHYINDYIPVGNYTLTADLSKDSFPLVTVVQNFTIFGNMKTSIDASFSLDDLSSAPEAPSSLTAEEGLHCINLSWIDNSFKEMRYVIERSTDRFSGYIHLDELLPPNTTKFSDTTPLTNIIYYYRVYAVNRYGDSDRSEVATGLLGIPYPPSRPDLIEEDDTGSDSTDNITFKHVVSITGETEVDTVVDIYSENPLIKRASGIPNASGIWTATLTLNEGDYILKAVALDSIGNTSDFSPTLALTIDSTPPSEPDVTGFLATFNTRPIWGFSLPAGCIGYRYRLDDQAWTVIDNNSGNSYQPEAPLEKGTGYTFEIQARDVAGNWSGSGSHTIYIINNTFDGLELTGSWKRPYGIPSEGIKNFAVQGSFIYIATGQDIKIYNITNPLLPVFEGLITPSAIDEEFYTLAVYQNYLYTIGDNSSLKVYNITDPSHPAFAGEITFSSESSDAVYDMVISNGYLYVLISDKGLFIFNLSTPGSPSLEGNTGELTLSDDLCDIFVQGTQGYIASFEHGIHILDFTTIASPADISTIVTSGIVRSLTVINNTLYIADKDQDIVIYDVTDPALPAAKGNFFTGTIIADFAGSGDVLYTGNGDMGINAYTITDPFSPLLSTNIPVKTTSIGLKVNNSYLYVNSNEGGIEIYDITVPNSPSFCARIPTSEKATSVYTSGNLAFISDGLMGVKLIDIQTPSAPILINSIQTSGKIQKLYCDGTYLYLGDTDDGLLIYDITDPVNPTVTGHFTLPGITSFDIDNNIAYVITDSSNLCIIDITNPANPNSLGQHSIGGQLKDILVKDDHAYIAQYSPVEILTDLIVINISNSLYPVFEQYINTLRGAFKLYTFGDFLFIAHDWGALSKFDISDPSAINILQTNTSFASVSGMWGQDAFLFIIDSINGYIKTLHILDITTTVPNGDYSFNHPGNYLFARDEFIYLTTGMEEEAFYIFQK